MYGGLIFLIGDGSFREKNRPQSEIEKNFNCIIKRKML